ncbi:MAG: cohesin domain-containing protein [Euryarchaeota archaeon]|nr:cohesin domain-containing protein [Euryarchaeota archaeon]
MNGYPFKIFVLCMVIGASGAAAAAPAVTISPASTTGLTPGDSFSINIDVDPDGNGVASGEICLLFDTSVLEVTNRVKGDMLGTNALDVGSAYDNTAGTVIAVLARQGTTTSPTAAGAWATVTFNVKTGAVDGATTIAITSAGMVDGSFADITGITTTDGTAILGGGGTYPKTTHTVTLTQSTPSATPDTTATAANTAKPATGGGKTTPDAPEKKGLPGFEGAIAIAGLLAIGYVMMRWKR